MIELREAREADYPATIALTNRAYREPTGQTGWKVETIVAGQRIDAALLREDLARPGAMLLIAAEPGAPHLGHVRLDATPDGTWFLGMLTVDPERQDAGLGRQVLEASEVYARDRGALRICMTVIAQRHELIAWYQRRGYRRTGETKPFPYGDTRFGAPTRDDLCFEVLDKRLAPAGAEGV